MSSDATVRRGRTLIGTVGLGIAVMVLAAASYQAALEFPESLFARPAGASTMNVLGRPVPLAPGYSGFAATSVAQAGGTLYFIGQVEQPTGVTTHLIAVRETAGRPRAVGTIRLNGRPLGAGRLLASGDTVIIAHATTQSRLVGGRWTAVAAPDTTPRPLSQAPSREEGRTFAFADWRAGGPVQWWTVSEGGITAGLIRDGEDTDSVARRTFTPPRPPWPVYVKLRPRAVASGESEDGSTFATGIGAFQQVGRRIWFGTTFYDSEFHTGIGGVGSFDLDTRKYEMRWGAGSPDVSTAAILVSGDDVWMGFTTRGEGGDGGGGSAHYSLKTGKSTELDVPGRVTAIGRLGESVFFSTTVGIFRVTGPRTLPVWVDWEK